MRKGHHPRRVYYHPAIALRTHHIDSALHADAGQKRLSALVSAGAGEPGSPFRLFPTLGLAVTIISMVVFGSILKAVNAMAVLGKNIAQHRLVIERRRVLPCKIAISLSI